MLHMLDACGSFFSSSGQMKDQHRGVIRQHTVATMIWKFSIAIPASQWIYSYIYTCIIN